MAQSDEQVARGSERVLRQLEATAALARAPEPEASAAAAGATPAAPSVTVGSATELVLEVPTRVRVSRTAQLDLLQPSDVDATVERIEQLLDRMAAASSASLATETSLSVVPVVLPGTPSTGRAEMSSVLKKRKKAMNKHKYKKRLKMTRALRKSLNK